MKIMLDFTKKYLKCNKKRTIVTIVGVALAAAFLFLIALIGSTLIHNQKEQIIEQQGSHHAIFQNQTSAQYQKLKQNKQVGQILTEYHIDEIEKENIHLSIVSKNIDYSSKINLSSGRFPQSTSEIIISKTYSIFSEYSLNDDFIVNDHVYKIVGIFDYSTIHYFYYDQYSYFSNEYAYTKYEENQKETANYYITLKNPKNAYQQIKLIAEDLELKFMGPQSLMYENLDINTNLLDIISNDMNDKGLKAIITILMWIIMSVVSLATIFIVYNSFSISVTERKKMFGILASIGATPKQILFSVFFEGCLVALLGIPFGFLLSVGAMSLGLALVNHILVETLTIPFYLSFDIGMFFIALFFLLIIVFLSSLFPAKRASEVTPLEAIRMTSDIKIKRKKLKAPKFIRKLFGIEGELAYKNIKRSKKKYRVTTFAIVISIILSLLTATYVNYAQEQINLSYKDKRKDFIISIPNTEEAPNMLKEIKKIEGIQDLFYYRTILAMYKNEDSLYTEEYLQSRPDYKKDAYNELLIYTVEDDLYQSMLQKIGVKDTDLIIFNWGNIYVGSHNGDAITKEMEIFDKKKVTQLQFCNHETHECSYQINHLTFTKQQLLEAYDAEAINATIVKADLYDSIVSTAAPRFQEIAHMKVTVNAKNLKDVDQKLKELTTQYKDLQYYSPGLETYQYDQMVLAVQVIVYGFIFFIVLIAITNIINTLNTNLQLRRKEFAMLRSVGLTPKGFNKMMRLESIFLGIKSLLWGIIITFVLVYFINQTFLLSQYSQTGIMRMAHIPIMHILYTIGGVLLIIFLTMYYAIKKIKKENILQTIREENT